MSAPLPSRKPELGERACWGEHLDDLDVDEHRREFIETAWQLGAQPHLAGLKLRRWAHTLGFRGHWATRSRRYSTTLTALRETRRRWRREGLSRDCPGADVSEGFVADTFVLADWIYAGSGYRTPGDAWLAHTAQQQNLEARRERRALAHRVGDEPC